MQNMDAQGALAAARQLLQSSGAPMSTENLNRAMLHISRGGEGSPELARGNARSNGRGRTPSVGGASSGMPIPPAMEDLVDDTLLRSMGEQRPAPAPATAVGTTSGEVNGPPMARRADRVDGSDPGVRRGSLRQAVQPIVEDDPMMGYQQGSPNRQAVDVEDPTALALDMGLAGASGLRLAAPAVQAAVSAIPNLGITLNRPALSAPRPSIQGQLPGSAPNAIAAPVTPQLPGGAGQLALPAPQAAPALLTTQAAPASNQVMQLMRERLMGRPPMISPTMPNAEGFTRSGRPIPQGFGSTRG